MKSKGLPQVREILTQYGPICLIWYDTPRTITKEQSTEFVNQVRRLQPDCLINSRVGHGLGDYGSTGDNRIPGSRRIGDWETPATMNRTWGYKHNDTDWKSTEQIIHNLVNIVSKGGNYLLNVGPTAEGIIPEPSIKIMREVGCWMDKNSESIYGTVANPLGKLPWGRCTAKTGKVYLHVFDWPQDGKLEIAGLQNKLKKAYLLAGKTKLSATQDGNKIVVKLPKECPDSIDTVVVLAIDGDAQISETEQVGNTNILRAGKYTLSVKPDTKVKTSAINLKVIRLLPVQK
jgi:alpha-L-fucosidase